MKRTLPLILISAGILIISAAMVYLDFGRSVNEPAPILLPSELAGLSLTNSSYGKEAIAEVTRLHGQSFPLTAGAIGNYGTQQGVTIWVVSTAFEGSAQRMLIQMEDRINEGNSPFSPVDERNLKDRTIFELEGMNQTHFYFRSADKLIWVAANPSLAANALAAVLEFYP